MNLVKTLESVFAGGHPCMELDRVQVFFTTTSGETLFSPHEGINLKRQAPYPFLKRGCRAQIACPPCTLGRRPTPSSCASLHEMLVSFVETCCQFQLRSARETEVMLFEVILDHDLGKFWEANHG